MEITELNFISNFASQISPFSTLSEVPKIYSLCKWAALVLAILAAFSSLIARTKLLFFSKIKIFSSPALDSIKLLNSDDFDFDYEDDDDIDYENDTCSSVSSDESYEERQSSSDEGYYVAKTGRQFSWSDFTTGKSVVRLWDNLAAGFDCNEEQEYDVVSVSDKNVSYNLGAIVTLRLYDSRVRNGLSEITTQWPEMRRRAVMGRDATGDERMESEADSWWHANTVVGVDYR